MPCLVTAALSCKQNSPLPQVTPIRLAVPSWYAPPRCDLLKKAVAGWNAGNPKTPVELKVIFGKRDAIRQKIFLGAKRGNFADVALVRNEWIGQLAKGALIRPISEELGESLRDKSIGGILKAVDDSKNLWAIPYDADVFVLWVRKDLLATDSIKTDSVDLATLESIAGQVSTTSQKKKGRYGLAFATMRAATTGIGFFPWYFSTGGKLSVQNRHVRLDKKSAKETLRRLKSFVDQKIAPPNTPSLHQGAVFSGLAGGAYAMTVGGSWERNMLQSQSELAESFVALPVSRKPGECASLIGGWSFVILTDNGKSSEKFFLKLFGDEFQTEKLEQQSLLPVNQDTLHHSWFASNPDGNTFKTSLQNGCAFPFAENLDLLIDRISIIMAKVFLGKMTIEEAVEEL